MKIRLPLLLLFIFLRAGILPAQVSISTNNALPESSAMLDVQSTEKGMLIPRMTAAQRDAIVAPSKGLLVFVNTDSSFYYFDGTNWLPVSVDAQALDISGNTLSLTNGGSVDLSDFKQSLSFNTNTLSLTNGNSVNLSSLKDNLGNHSTTQNLILNDNWLSRFGSDEGIRLGLKNEVTMKVNGGTATHDLEILSTGNTPNIVLNQNNIQKWSIQGNQSSFTVKNLTGGYDPFGISSGAPSGSLLIEDSGMVKAGEGLQVNGNIQMIDGNQADGYVAVSDGAGTMSWTNPENIYEQNLSLNNNTLSLTNGGSVDLSDFKQTLSFNTNTLSLTNGGSVDLSGYLDNTDDQALSLSSNTLSLTNGGSVDLSNLTYDKLTDQDNDTRIEVEENPDDDIIRFYSGGIEVGKVNSEGKWDLIGASNSLLIGNGNNGTGGDNNTFIGNAAGLPHASGNNNTALGSSAMGLHETGANNTALGAYSLHENISGKANTAIGHNAGYFNLGDLNVFIGKNAGYNETGSHKLYIDNSTTSDPLLYGEFDNDFLKVNGEAEVIKHLYVGSSVTSDQSALVLGRAGQNPNIQSDGSGNNWLIADGNVANNGRAALNYYSSGNVILANGGGKVGVGETTPDTRLHVTDDVTTTHVAMIENTSNAANANGLLVKAGENFRTVSNSFISFQRPDGLPIGSIVQNTSNTVAYNTISDQRLKTGFKPTLYGLESLLQIEVKDYTYINDPNHPESGFIAQQLYEHYPIAVVPGGDDPKSDPWTVSYGRVTPLLVKSVQQLADRVGGQQELIEALESQIKTLQAQNKLLSEQNEDLKADVQMIKEMLLNNKSKASNHSNRSDEK